MPGVRLCRNGLLLFYYLRRDMIRELLVMREIHRERPAPARYGPEVGCVRQNLRHRYERAYDIRAGKRIEPGYLSPPGVDVAYDVTHAFVRYRYLHLHYRL